MPSTLLRIVRKRLGERGVHALPAKAQVPRTPDYLDDVGGSPRGRAMPPIARR